MAKQPFLERAGVGYFKRRSAKLTPINAEDAVHFLNADERRTLRRIQHLCVARAALVGAFSAGVVGYFDHFVLDHSNTFTHYAWLGLLTGVLAVFEIAFLYWDSLRSVHDLAHAAGLELFGTPAEEREAVAAALARAALELPNSPDRVFGVDPRREVGKIRLILVGLAYKAKVGVSNFLFKALLRRAMGRALVRGYLAFAAVPVTAAWNGFVAFKVLREARIRVLGPSATEEMCRIIFEAGGPLSPLARDTVLRAVASAIVRTRDMHPNLQHLLVHVTTLLQDQDDKDLDDPSVFLAQLTELSDQEQLTVLRILNVSSIIDGRLTVAETKLVKDALAATGHQATSRYVKKLRRAFVSGDAIGEEMVLKVWE